MSLKEVFLNSRQSITRRLIPKEARINSLLCHKDCSKHLPVLDEVLHTCAAVKCMIGDTVVMSGSAAEGTSRLPSFGDAAFSSSSAYLII